MENRPAGDPSGLIRSASTMVLATSDPGPWAAPVYYVHLRGRFWFLSSPESRHVRAALASGRCAASIHRDSERWQEIEGVQMDGTVEEAAPGPDAEAAIAAYVEKFPAVRDLLGGATPDVRTFEARFRVRLYAFTAGEAFHVDNRGGLSGRHPVTLPR